MVNKELHKDIIEQRKYNSVVRHGKSGTHLTVEGNPYVVIQEKLDGANASFLIKDGKIQCFSRRLKLDASNTLNGFVNWVEHHVDPNKLIEGYIYYGEWLTRHKLNYGEHENKFYLFDVYNIESNTYLSFDIVTDIAEELSVPLIPVFYEGEYISHEHAQSFVGKSMLPNVEVGEGVVIKNYEFRNKHGEQLFSKVVSEAFAETQMTKANKVAPEAYTVDDFVNTYVTEARVEKTVFKLQDENIIPKELALEDMGKILGSISKEVYADIVKEELNELLKVVQKRTYKKVPPIVRSVILETVQKRLESEISDWS